MIKAIFFDFDGVLVESKDIKLAAFIEMFSKYPHKEEIDDYLKRNEGVSRFEKFKHIYGVILKKPLSDKEMEKLSNHYSSLVLKELLTCPSVNGAEHFLKTYSKKISLFLVSATPHKELEYIAEKRGIKPYFKKIFGAPLPKYEAIQLALNMEKLHSADALYVGDALSDYEHAKKCGVRFVGRILPKNENPFPKTVRVIKDLSELEKILGDDSG